MDLSYFGTRVQNLSRQETGAILEQVLQRDQGVSIFTPNTEIVMEAKDKPAFQELLNSGNLRLADGIGLVIGAKLKGFHLKERVTGFDVSLDLLKLAQDKGYRVYFLGGKEGRARQAKEEVEKDYPGIQVVGSHHGYFKKSLLKEDFTPEEEEILKEIQDLKVDIIFVGLGFPIQEIFIKKALDFVGKGVWIGNGGVLNILAKEEKRAPDIFIRLHLEWFYRLLKDPSRWKRQLNIPRFLLELAKNKDAIELVKGDTIHGESKSN